MATSKPTTQSHLRPLLTLILLQGIRIPTLGSFEVVPTRIQVGDEVSAIPCPVFRLARNIAETHGLVDNKDYLPGRTVALWVG